MADIGALTQQAESGDAESMFKLAKAFASGDGTDQDTNKAALWFEKASDAGHPTAADELMKLYE